MTMFGLIAKELRHRWGTALLSLLGVVLAVSFCVAMVVLAEAAQRETRRTMRDIGSNLRIVPADTDMNAFYRTGYSDRTLDHDKAIAALKGVSDVTYNHLIATLQVETDIAGYSARLTGLAPDLVIDGKKSAMSVTIPDGEAHAGADLAKRLKLEKNDSLDVQGKKVKIVRVMPEAGTIDDIRLLTSLKTAQEIAGLPGKINEIKAIDCIMCKPSVSEPDRVLREQIESALPDAKVVILRDMAVARARQRMMLDGIVAYGVPTVLVVCALWVGALAGLNVWVRRTEIGLLRALGSSSTKVGGVFFGKAVALGLLGALVGFALGNASALWLGPKLFPITSKALSWQPWLFVGSLIAAPLFVALASLMPTLFAMFRDPAEVLREG